MKQRPSQAGFSLVEVTLALGVAGICLVAVMGLLPVGLTSNRTAIEQTGSLAILSSVATDLRATPVTSPPGAATTTVQYSIAIPANPINGNPAPQTLFFSEDGKHSATLTSTSRFRVTVSFIANEAARSATPCTLKATWPAAIDPATATPAGSATMFVALDRN